jgi:hypothetical protein
MFSFAYVHFGGVGRGGVIRHRLLGTVGLGCTEVFDEIFGFIGFLIFDGLCIYGYLLGKDSNRWQRVEV